MNIEEIKSSSWLTNGLAPEKLETEKALAVISAEIYLRRKELGWDQKRFAKEMGVSQCMVSKWESQEYNFTIETLIKICTKLNLQFIPEIVKKKDEPELLIFNSYASQNDWFVNPESYAYVNKLPIGGAA